MPRKSDDRSVAKRLVDTHQYAKLCGFEISTIVISQKDFDMLLSEFGASLIVAGKGYMFDGMILSVDRPEVL